MDVGLSTCGKIINEELFKQFADNNITHMEISVAAEEYKNLDYKAIKAYAEKYDVTLWSFHLPFSPFETTDISRKHLKYKTIKYFNELIDKASDIGITNFIIHPSSEPILPRFREMRFDNAADSLYILAEKAEKCGAGLLVEDLPRSCLGNNSDEILKLISVHKNLSVCFDTNHLLDESIMDFIDKVGDKIKSTHISDYDMLNERHWLPGEGVVEWHSVYKKLSSIGYDGPWLYEVGFNAPSTVKRLRPLNCGDFYKNSIEIFSNSKITVLSEPVTGLSAWKK